MLTQSQLASMEAGIEMDELYQFFTKRYAETHPQLVEDVGRIITACREVLKECHRFDYSPDIPANGFRSLVIKWNQLLSFSLNKMREDQLGEFENIISILLRLIPYVKSQLAHSFDDRMIPNERNVRDCLDFIKTVIEDKTMDTIFNSITLHFDNGIVWSFLMPFLFIFISGYISEGYVDYAKSLILPSFRTSLLRNFYQIVPYEKFLDLCSASTSFFVTRIIPWITFGPYVPSFKETIKIPTQDLWSLEFDSVSRTIQVKYRSGTRIRSKNLIECNVYREAGTSLLSDKIMVYVHGGGFLAGDHHMLNNFLPRFARRMPGLTIVALDYTLSRTSEGKFPGPVNEILDLILWLQSDELSVFKMLKISHDPSDYILAGDSCGALMMMQSLLAMNEINRMIRGTTSGPIPGSDIRLCKEHLIRHPSRLLALSPVLSHNCTFFPSLLLGVRDLTLFTAYLPHMCPAYLPNLHTVVTRPDGTSEVVLEECTTEWSRKNVAHTSSTEEIIVGWKKYFSLLNHGLFNPMYYEHLEDFAHIPLHAMMSTEDPIMDLGLVFLKHWKGAVTLDVLPVLRHAFFYYLTHSHYIPSLGRRLTEAENIVFKRLTEEVTNGKTSNGSCQTMNGTNNNIIESNGCFKS